MTIFEAHNAFLKKFYGKTAGRETFKRFVRYCQTGQMENGVKPILNPINLYAFGHGISSQEASDLMFRKETTDE